MKMSGPAQAGCSAACRSSCRHIYRTTHHSTKGSARSLLERKRMHTDDGEPGWILNTALRIAVVPVLPSPLANALGRSPAAVQDNPALRRAVLCSGPGTADAS